MRYIQESTIYKSNMDSEYIEQNKVFQDVYLFTTESVSGYFPQLNLKGKSLLTVGSSLDQAYNALVLGAEEITVLDINANIEKYHYVKSDIIIKTPRNEMYEEVLKSNTVPCSQDLFSKNAITKANLYLHTEEKYNLLRDKLKEERITFINGSIFDMDNAVKDKTYDRMVFSNVLQYLEFLSSPEDPYEYLAKNFEIWKKHLNSDGIMQLLYLYSFRKEDLLKENNTLCTYNLRKISETLQGNSLELEWIPGIAAKEDAVVTYTKKR